MIVTDYRTNTNALNDSAIKSLTFFFTLSAVHLKHNYGNVQYNRLIGCEQNIWTFSSFSLSHRRAPWHIWNFETSCLHFYKIFRQEGRTALACLRQKLLEIKKALILNFANKKDKLTTDDCLKRTYFLLKSTKE